MYVSLLFVLFCFVHMCWSACVCYVYMCVYVCVVCVCAHALTHVCMLECVHECVCRDGSMVHACVISVYQIIPVNCAI